MGRTALILSSSHGHTMCVAHLLRHGADKDAQSKSGETALMEACSNGHNAVVQRLLGAKAKLKIKDHGGNTALVLASFFGQTTAVRLLIRAAGGRVGTREERSRKMALECAKKNGHKGGVAILLEATVEAGAMKRGKSEGGLPAAMEG